MMIDKAIEKYRKLSNNDRACNREEAMQLAEWLEELKALKADGFADSLLNTGYTKGYNKAVENFVNRAIEWNNNSTKKVPYEFIRKTADELKGGVK